jgi:hypothetical protein
MGPVEDLGPEIVEGVRRIRAKDGPGLIVWGSSTLTPVLLERSNTGLLMRSCCSSIRSC